MSDEAASGLEPLNRGFADLRLSHLAMPPYGEAVNNASHIKFIMQKQSIIKSVAYCQDVTTKRSLCRTIAIGSDRCYLVSDEQRTIPPSGQKT